MQAQTLGFNTFGKGLAVIGRNVFTRPLRTASACLLAALCLSVVQGLGAGERMASPSVQQPDEITDAQVLADRILQRQGTGLLLETVHRDQLIREIGQVLIQVRTAYPELADVSPRLDYRPGMLLVGLVPALLAGTMLAERENGVPTGFAKFDALNALLGLQHAQVFRRTGVAALHFGKPVNLEAATRAYLKIPGVQFAQPDAQLGDGPDMAVSSARGTWHVAVREAWGDCPSGCIHEELSFFTVHDGTVRRIENAQALQEDRFSALIASRGWH